MTTSSFAPHSAQNAAPHAAPALSAAPTIQSILVATDCTTASDGAIFAALLLAARHHASVDVLTVVEPWHRRRGDPVAVTPPHSRIEEYLDYAHAQVDRIDGASSERRVLLKVGDPAESICQMADEHGADLIVLGFGGRPAHERSQGSETAFRVASRSKVPVLVVPQSLGALPMRVLVGVDFSPASVAAAQTAVLLADRGAEVHLAYVRASDVSAEPDSVGDDVYLAGLGSLAAKLAHERPECGGTIATRTVLSGDPGVELLAYAAEHAMDLIAIGSHGRSKLEEIIFGGVATRIIRHSECAVLVSGLVADETTG